MRLFVSLLFSLIFAYTTFLFPVSLPDSNASAKKTDALKVSAERLQQKILLSDEQTTKVKSILSEYLKTNSTDANSLASLQDKIIGFLDQKQKAKFDIIKNEWSNSFLKEVKKSPAIK